jgi:gamma-glutamyltranspeptidase / glutathione hydrolase
MNELTPTRPELAGDFGMVASTHWLASAVGMAMLERGGNAADAAVAAGFVLQVVEPHLNGPAGEVPILVSDPAGEVSVICGQGCAPAAADLDVFAALGLTEVPGTGLLAATVPGSFGAWTLLLQRWGTMRLREVLEPAIGYALDGAPVLPRVSATIAEMQHLFEAEWTPSAQTYLDHGRVPQPWSRLRLTELGQTYRRVLAEAEAAGPDREAQLEAARAAWYRGFVAERIDRFCAGPGWLDTSGERHRGLLTGDDLAGWQPTVEAPVTGVYRGIEVCKPGPWSAGPVLLQQLGLLSGFDLGDLALTDPGWVHLVIESQKLSYADREAWYGDPVAVQVPMAALLGADYTDRRRAEIDPTRADLRLRPGAPTGRPPVLPRLAEFDAEGVPVPGAGADPEDPVDGTPLAARPAGTGEPTMAAPASTPASVRASTPASGSGAVRGDTCHLDVVDRWGGMVSATPSGAWLQSSPVVAGLGFPLGTRGQMFRLQPGLPATLRPGTRPRTTLSPTLLRRDGAAWAALGTPGGDQQDQWSLLLLLRLAHAAAGPMALQAAIDAPAFHTEHTPSSFYPRAAAPGRVVIEERWPASVRAELDRRGHRMVVSGGWSLGRLSAVAREPGGWLRAAANPRGAQGYAVGR